MSEQFGKFNVKTKLLRLTQSPLDVQLLELVESGEDTGAGDATEDVGAGSLHQGHEPFVLHDLDEAVHGSLVFDGLSGGHHHTPTDGVDGVGHEAGGDVTIHPRMNERKTEALSPSTMGLMES